MMPFYVNVVGSAFVVAEEAALSLIGIIANIYGEVLVCQVLCLVLPYLHPNTSNPLGKRLFPPPRRKPSLRLVR